MTLEANVVHTGDCLDVLGGMPESSVHAVVSAEGQLVLDPFAGSGTTCRAAKDLGRRFVGIEKQSKWADVARVRTGLSPNDPANVRDDDAQRGLEVFNS